MVLRFFLGRQNGETARPPTDGCPEFPKAISNRKGSRFYLRIASKRNDRRGRHTKADVLARRQALAAITHRLLCPPRACGCDARVPLAIADGFGVCTGCGVVDPDLPVYSCVGSYQADGGTGLDDWENRGNPLLAGVVLPMPSAPYRRENHLAELLKQATDTDPRIPKDDMHLIEEHWRRYIHTHYEGAPLDPLLLGRGDIKGVLKEILPARKCKKYAERWLQIWRYICGRDQFDSHGPSLLPVSVCHLVHRRYSEFAAAFEELKEQRHPLFRYRHNIPNLNTTVLHLLYQDDPQHLADYGWYFTPLETLASRLITEVRICCIIKHLQQKALLTPAPRIYHRKLLPEIDRYYLQEEEPQRETFLWRYEHQLLPEDTEFFSQRPDRFGAILQQQVKQCLQPKSPLLPTPMSSSPSTADTDTP